MRPKEVGALNITLPKVGGAFNSKASGEGGFLFKKPEQTDFFRKKALREVDFYLKRRKMADFHQKSQERMDVFPKEPGEDVFHSKTAGRWRIFINKAERKRI